MSDPSVAGPGEVAEEPQEDDVYASELDMGLGEIGVIFQWSNLEGGWILANNTESFTSLDRNR